MFLPDYSITNNIINALSSIEYAKALVENIPVLTSIENQIRKQAKTKTLTAYMNNKSVETSYDEVKRYLDGLIKHPNEKLTLLNTTLGFANSLEENYTVTTLKKLYTLLSNTEAPNFRTQREKGFVDPEEILAMLVELMDWCSSIDALETHAVITTGIIKAQLEKIRPFDNEDLNDITTNLLTRMNLRWRGYKLKDYLSYEDKFRIDKHDYEKARISIFKDEPDLTHWLEYFSQTLARDAMDITEKVKQSAKETKVAKNQGRTELSERQTRILEHLSDYGRLTNKDFTVIFPEVSEDSVLRDLKVLSEKGVIQKVGITKSSRYVLK